VVLTPRKKATRTKKLRLTTPVSVGSSGRTQPVDHGEVAA
jgi:hypothetical protein